MPNKLTLAIPCMNQLRDFAGIVGLMRMVTSDETTWLIIDNGSTDPVENFFYKNIKPKRINFIRNEENIGLVKTYQQIYENCDTEEIGRAHV